MRLNFVRNVQFVFALLSVLSTISSAYGQNSIDILGIRTGTSLHQAKNIIVERKEKFEESPVLVQVGRVKKDIGKSFFTGQKNAGHSQIVVAVDGDQKIWFVGQAQHFDVGERLEYQTLFNSLVAKYGNPTISPQKTTPNTNGPFWQPTYSFSWMYDDQNKLVTSSQLDFIKSGACDSATFGDNYSVTIGADLIIPRFSNPICSMLIVAEVRFDYYTKKITALSVSMLNSKILFDDPILGQSSRERHASLNKLKDENRLAKVPKL